MKKLNGFLKSMKSLREKMEEEGKKLLNETFRELFEKYPELDAIGWTQYAPYFNDGEPCEFSVHSASYRLKSDGEPLTEDDISSHFDGLLPHSAYSDNKKSPLHSDIYQLSEAIQSMEDVVRSMFGDDNGVVVIKNKVHVVDLSGAHD